MNMEELPTLVLDKLVSFLDYGSRKKLRLVCRTLKAHVDRVGLSVVIDTREEGIRDFCQAVTVTEARSLYLKDAELLEQGLGDLHTAILSGNLATSLLLFGLHRSCPLLKVLILNGAVIVAQDFGGSLTLFENLAHVQVGLSWPGFCRGADSLSELIGKTVESCRRKLDTRVQKNMTFLMRNLRSRSLKVLAVGVYFNIGQEDWERKLRWEHAPLFECLQAHRLTLQTFIAPYLLSGREDLVQEPYAVPTRLKTFYWKTTERIPIPTFWKDMLLAQEALETLAMCELMTNGDEFLPLIRSVLASNATTLTTLDLHISPTPNTTFLSELDMRVFCACECLRELLLNGDDNAYQSEKLFRPDRTLITNLNKLPTHALRSLKICGVYIGPDFDPISFLAPPFNPIALVLYNLSDTGPVRDPAYLLRFLKAAFRMRELSVFWIAIDLDEFGPGGPTLDLQEQEEVGLGFHVLMCNLEAAAAAGSKGTPPLNHRCTTLMVYDSVDFTQVAEQVRNVVRLDGGGPDLYEEKKSNVTWLELLWRPDVWEAREQPLLLNPKAGSFSHWKNLRTGIGRITENKGTYSARLSDIRRVKFRIDLKGDGRKKFKDFEPVGMREVKRRLGLNNYAPKV